MSENKERRIIWITGLVVIFLNISVGAFTLIHKNYVITVCIAVQVVLALWHIWITEINYRRRQKFRKEGDELLAKIDDKIEELRLAKQGWTEL